MSQLEDDVKGIASGMKILGDSLIGFSTEVTSTFEDYNKKLEMLKDYAITQTREIREILQNVTEMLDQKTTMIAIMSNFNDYRLSKHMAMQNNLVILLDAIQKFDQIFATLRRGRLSRGLLSFSKLKRILNNIQEAFQHDFEFAINESENHLYYSFPLIAFSISQVTNEIYISLRIPLVRRGQPKTYNLIKPQFLPFSCLDQGCLKYDSSSKSEDFISIRSNDKIWLTNVNDGNLMQEIDLSSITCEYINHKRICFTFETNQILEPNECNKGIYAWNVTKIFKNCGFDLDR